MIQSFSFGLHKLIFVHPLVSLSLILYIWLPFLVRTFFFPFYKLSCSNLTSILTYYLLLLYYNKKNESMFTFHFYVAMDYSNWTVIMKINYLNANFIINLHTKKKGRISSTCLQTYIPRQGQRPARSSSAVIEVRDNIVKKIYRLIASWMLMHVCTSKFYLGGGVFYIQSFALFLTLIDFND